MDKCLISSNKSILIKFLIKSWLETYLEQNYLNSQAFFLLSDFLFHKLQNIPLALKYLTTIPQSKYTSIYFRYKVLRLKLQILKFNNKSNQEAYKKKL